MFGLEFILMAGLALAAAGTGTQMYAASQAADAQEKNLEAQGRAEAARKAGMEIDANRRRREMIRSSIIQRSQALATTTAQGASFGSALGGAYGQIAGTTAQGVSGVTSNQLIGNELFSANQQMLGARKDEANAGMVSAIGGGLSSLGGLAITGAGSINRLGGNFTGGYGASSTRYNG